MLNEYFLNQLLEKIDVIVKNAINEAYEMNSPRIIFGFSCIGKSYFISTHKNLKIVDYDDPEFPKDPNKAYQYILNSNADIILGWTGDVELMEFLASKNISFEIVMPNPNRVKEFYQNWINRDLKNGINQETAIKFAKTRIDDWKSQFNAVKNIVKKFPNITLSYLSAGEFLSDYLKF